MSNVKITNAMQKKICVLIRTWEGKFGWKGLIAALKHDYSFSITKPSLIGNEAIYKEFRAKKQGNRGTTSDPVLVGATEEELIKEINVLEEKLKKAEAGQALAEEAQALQLKYIEDTVEIARTLHVDMIKLFQRGG